MNRIKIFTIVEIVLAMLLSSIVILMAYKIYGNVERYVLKSINSDNKKSELLFRTSFMNDFNKATRVLSVDSGILINIDSNTVKYMFGDSLIVRVASNRDSFLVNVVERKFWNDTLLVFNANEVIDKIDLHLIYNEELIVIHEDRAAASNEYFK